MPDALVYDLNRRKVPGLHHNLKLNEFNAIEGELLGYHVWMTECVYGNHSAVMFIAIVGAGKGTIEMNQKRLGPLLG